MKISHIAAKVNETPCLTHFLHLRDATNNLHIVNILNILDIEFKENIAEISIQNSPKITFIVSQPDELSDLKKFFQVV